MSDSSTTLSRTRSQSHLDRTRSQNGYGVDDDDENDPTQGDDGEDPYEVGWDEGESGDPLCPRSFPKARKWLITFIVSHVSLCLYVFV
jgi:hypothetical protein